MKTHLNCALVVLAIAMFALLGGAITPPGSAGMPPPAAAVTAPIVRHNPHAVSPAANSAALPAVQEPDAVRDFFVKWSPILRIDAMFLFMFVLGLRYQMGGAAGYQNSMPMPRRRRTTGASMMRTDRTKPSADATVEERIWIGIAFALAIASLLGAMRMDIVHGSLQWQMTFVFAFVGYFLGAGAIGMKPDLFVEHDSKDKNNKNPQ